MPRLFLAGLDVDYEGVATAVDDQVGSAGEGGCAAAKLEAVLGFDVNVVAVFFPLGFLLVQVGGVVEQPLGLVKVTGLSGPTLVVGLEPDGLLAGVLAGQEAR